jgi:hypothetical protein
MSGFAFRGRRGSVAAVALGLAVAGCGVGVKGDAAADIAAFLKAARVGDRSTFEAHLDRSLTRDDLRAQLQELPGVRDLQAQLGETMGEGALDRLISPDAVRRLQATADPTLSGEDPAQLKPVLKAVGKGRVCVRDREVKERCLLTFEEVDKTWKLVGMHVAGSSFEPPSVEGAAAARDDGGEEP